MCTAVIGLYLHSVTETKLIVDTSRGERLRINFDIVFPALPCSLLSLDAMDISGEEHLDIKHDIYKKRIDANGVGIESRQGGIGATKIDRPLQRHGGRLEQNETYCGSCFGAQAKEEDCCNSCEEVREAYRAKGWALSDPDSIDQCKREGLEQVDRIPLFTSPCPLCGDMGAKKEREGWCFSRFWHSGPLAVRALSHMDSSMCSSAPDPEMWIIQGTLAWRTPPEEGGNMHTRRAQYNGELCAAFEKDESLSKRNLLILS
nr:endoplasmic reticulum-Golgi intermediate compartment protein 3 [Tanacetum cinerariifolium]